MKSKQNSGALYILISAILLSLGGLLIKIIPWSALAVNGGRNIFAAAVTFAYMKATGRRLRFTVPAFACGLCLAANAIIYTLATRNTTAGNAIVIQYTSPIFIILYLWLFFRKKPKKLDVAACGIVFCGIVFFFLESISGGGMLGNLLAVAAAATYAVVFMVNMFEGSDSFSSFFYGQVFSALVGLPWLLSEPNKSPASWAAIAFMGIVQIGVAYIFMSKGLATTSPVTANIICMCEPILNPVWVAIFYGETIGALSFVGILIVMAGLLFYNIQNGKQTQAEST